MAITKSVMLGKGSAHSREPERTDLATQRLTFYLFIAIWAGTANVDTPLIRIKGSLHPASGSAISR